jgi:hypothetical protein
MAGVAFPSWAFNSAGQPAVIVANQAAFNALGGVGTWAQTPYPTATSSAPVDVGFANTDIRLQQMLIEQRTTNQLLTFGLNITDDAQTQIRPDILANDSSLTS